MEIGVSMGADRLEFDLRLTRDGQLVALHDPTLERTAHDARGIADLTLDELEAIAADTRPPTLEAILERFADSIPYSIELKDAQPPAEELLLDALARHRVSDVHVMSFEQDCLERVRGLDRSIPLIQLYRHARPPEEVLGDLARAAELCVGIGREVGLTDAALSDAAHARGLALYVYVVNDEAEMERLVGLGVAGLITDVPDRARAFLDR